MIRRPVIITLAICLVIIACVASWVRLTQHGRADAAMIWLHGGRVTGYESNFSVVFSGRQVSDSAFKYIRKIDEISLLQLINTEFSEAALKHLQGAAIKQVELFGSRFPESALRHLSNTEGIYELSLQETNTTNAGLTHLLGLPHLADLNLLNTQVTGDGIGQLKALHNLQRLWLMDSQLTDPALQQLSEFTELKWLLVYDVDSAGIDERMVQVRKVLPGVRTISYYDEHGKRLRINTEGPFKDLQIRPWAPSSRP